MSWAFTCSHLKFFIVEPSVNMNSSEPISPSPSTPSSGSPPPEEEANFNSQSSGSYLYNLASHVTTALGRGSAAPSSSKRRLPGSSYATVLSDRDPKARKKSGDAGRSNSQYEGPREVAARKDHKDELVDGSTVEWLRRGGYICRVDVVKFWVTDQDLSH